MIDIKRVKQHLRLEREDEDDYLQLLTQAAIQHFETWTGRTLCAKTVAKTALPEDGVCLASDIEVGLLMLIAHWYENREAVGATMSEAPMGTYGLWAGYRLIDL